MKVYTGIRPYAFMSYSHRDVDKIEKLVSKLQGIGCNIWYDEGIIPADEWAETIAKKLANASLFFLILSKNSVKSQNVKREIYYAVSHDIPILTYYLEDTELTQGLAMQLGISQSIRSTNNTEIDCNAIKEVFPQEAVSSKEPKILHSASKYLYTFVESANNEYSIVQIDRETSKQKTLFRHKDSQAFIPLYSCESIHLSPSDEFNPNQKDTLYFSVYSDLDPDYGGGVYMPRLYVQVDFSITDLGSDCPTLKIIGGRHKIKQDAFNNTTVFDGSDSLYWTKNADEP